MLYFALITLLIGKNAPSVVSQAHRPPDLWPPNSPDLKPVDYRIWGLMQRLYKTPVRDTIDLKKRLVDTWASISQCVVDETVDQWTPRLRSCVKAKGNNNSNKQTFVSGDIKLYCGSKKCANFGGL